MSSLQISSIITPHVKGNAEFSARKVRAGDFNGLMDPIIGFDHFELTNDIFGAHPHAGMSAISYVFEDSAVYHSIDSRGNDVLITPGSLMWTWAGKGIVHTEFPVPVNGKVKGLQLFINIPAAQKQLDSKSVLIKQSDMPQIYDDGLHVKVVTGFTGTLANQVATPETLTILHIRLKEGKHFSHTLPAQWSGTIYILDGRIDFTTATENLRLDGGNVLSIGNSDEDEIISFTGHLEAELILIAGIPTKEKLFSQGAMTMSSEKELLQALDDYKNGKMGFIEINGDDRKIILPV